MKVYCFNNPKKICFDVRPQPGSTAMCQKRTRAEDYSLVSIVIKSLDQYSFLLVFAAVVEIMIISAGDENFACVSLLLALSLSVSSPTQFVAFVPRSIALSVLLIVNPFSTKSYRNVAFCRATKKKLKNQGRATRLSPHASSSHCPYSPCGAHSSFPIRQATNR